MLQSFSRHPVVVDLYFPFSEKTRKCASVKGCLREGSFFKSPTNIQGEMTGGKEQDRKEELDRRWSIRVSACAFKSREQDAGHEYHSSGEASFKNKKS
jgi:hypothetical protein